MKIIVPVAVVCGIGIAASLVYIVAVCLRAFRHRPRRKREFEMDDDVLTVHLGRRGKRRDSHD